MDRSQPTRTVDRPEPCFIRMRRGRGTPWLAARIFVRLGMLMAEIDGQPATPESVWHSGDVISEAEYRTLLRIAHEPKPF